MASRGLQWTKKLHPTVLTPEECSKLLVSLKSSFRQHVEAEHGSPAHTDDQHSPHRPRRRGSFSSSAATSHHLESVLNHPLFSQNAPQRTRPRRIDPELASRVKENPARVFDEHVASGTANVPLAVECLRQNAQQVPRQNGRVGSRVLEWLWSSGTVHRLSVEARHRLLLLLTPHLVAEQRYKPIWNALALDRDLSGLADLYERRAILCQLVRAEVQSSGAETAISHASRARDEMKAVLEADSSLSAETRRMIMRVYLRPTVTVLEKEQSNVSAGGLADLKGLKQDIRKLESENEGREVAAPRRRAVSFGLDTADRLLQEHNFSAASWLMQLLRREYSSELGLEAAEDSKREASDVERSDGPASAEGGNSIFLEALRLSKGS